MKRKWLISLLILAILLVPILGCGGGDGADEFPIGALMDMVRNGEISRLEVKGESITATMLDGDRVKSNIGANISIYDLFEIYCIDPESVEVVFK